LRLRLKARETLRLAARLTRGGKTLAHRTVASLPAGTHTVTVAIGRDVKAGGATLRLRLTDRAGNVRRYRRPVHVPQFALRKRSVWVRRRGWSSSAAGG
jgi:hypothetical protein